MRLLASLALQNLGRRRARSLLLIAAVAIGSGVVFTGATLMRSVDDSMAVGFTRLGADMMVVPESALTNITAALLTVESTDLVLDADALDKVHLASVGRAAPQKIVRVEHSSIGSHHDLVDLIGIDPARDFTVQPWLKEKLNRDLRAGDVILGAGRDAPLGSQLVIFGRPHAVYGKLGRTGVGGVLGVTLGVAVMRFYERSLVYYLENIGVPFVWLDLPRMVVAAAAIALASAIGALGSLYPAWRASGRDANDLVRGEG